VKKHIQCFLISIILFLGMTNFSFANENDTNVEYEIQSSLKTKDYQEWIEYDKMYLEALSRHDSFSKSKMHREINILNEELNNIKENYYIKTNLGVKVYPHQVTGCINAITTGIMNRDTLLHKVSDFEYKYDSLYIKPELFSSTSSQIEVINNKLSFVNEKISDDLLHFTLKILNEDSSLSNVLKDSEVFMSPYILEKSHAFTARNYIVMSTPFYYSSFSTIDNNEHLFPVYSNVFYHEVGHIFVEKYIQSNHPNLIKKYGSHNLHDIDLDMKKDLEEIIGNYNYNINKDNGRNGGDMEELFCDAFGFYKTKQFVDINDYRYAEYKVKSYFDVPYIDKEYDKYFVKYLNNFEETNLVNFDVPNINLNTKEIKNLKNINYNYATTFSNVLKIELDDKTIDSLDENTDIILKLNHVLPYSVGIKNGVYIGKINKENPSKTILMFYGDYILDVEYKDKSTGKTFDLERLFVNVKLNK
jgi:hypothetical protein